MKRFLLAILVFVVISCAEVKTEELDYENMTFEDYKTTFMSQLEKLQSGGATLPQVIELVKKLGAIYVKTVWCPKLKNPGLVSACRALVDEAVRRL